MRRSVVRWECNYWFIFLSLITEGMGKSFGGEDVQVLRGQDD